MSIRQGNKVIANAGGGAGAIDNKSITKNSSQELQAIGVINMRNPNSSAIKFWTGTKARYDAIVTKNANTLYNITDDTDVSLTILEALYPVGSIYITTANICPLSTLISGSTWELVSSGVVTSVDTNVPVKGNGNPFGLNVNIDSQETGFSRMYESNNTLSYITSVTTSKGVGLTTDDSKSGIVGTVTRSTLSVNIFERTA